MDISKGQSCYVEAVIESCLKDTLDFLRGQFLKVLSALSTVFKSPVHCQLVRFSNMSVIQDFYKIIFYLTKCQSNQLVMNLMF